MSSDHSSPPRTSTRGTTERRAALNAKKDATTATKKRATFLGAEDDDDDTPFDFDQYDKKQRPSASSRTREKSPVGGAGGDGILGGAFDDLFNLGDGTGTGTGDGLDDALQGDLDADAAPVKKRKIVARMDETRLLGPTGFPRLVDDIKKIKIKGKGHEAQDLKRVLSVYQLWTHQMYPKTNLRDTLQSVEKLCHKRSLQKALKEYKDDWKNGKSTKPDSLHPEFDQDLDLEPEEGIFAGLNRKGSQSQSQTQTKEKEKEKEKGEDEDGFREEDLEDLFGDDDALMASLEAEAQQTQQQTVAIVKKSAPKLNEDYDEEGPPDAEEEDDDEAMAAMREMEDILS